VTDDTGLTVGEIAKLIPGARDTAGKIERIRHWARLGYFQATTNVHEGTGRHARYSIDVAYDCAFLNLFADIGIQVASSRLLTDAMAVARNELKQWRRARRKGAAGPSALDIGYTLAGSSGDVDALRRLYPDDPIVLRLTIDLNVLFEHVWTASGGVS
jgi:hypothetical protein